MTTFKTVLVIADTEPNFISVILINCEKSFFSVLFLFIYLSVFVFAISFHLPSNPTFAKPDGM